ncbi:MAG: AtpZ/AtpI family protein [Caldisericia bacterium]|nr:AtpZ/AtpI family protein [Caldisericia bacterium]
MKPGKIASEFVKSRMTAITALVTLLVPICLGGLAGFFLDRWLHTMPVFFLLLILCGLAAGVRSLMRFKI